MDRTEIVKLVKAGENETTEFKENFDKETIETAGAFANTKGGVILIGVSDKGKVTGTQIGKESLKDWVNQICQRTEPRIIPEIEESAISGMNIIAILIEEYPIKPVSVKGRCFRRVGNSNRTMTSREIADMHYLSSELSWDKMPMENATLKDIDLNKVKKYIKLANESGRKNIPANEKPLEVLEKLDLVKDGKPTWGAGLLFGKEGKHFVSQAEIHCGRFKEETVIIDNMMFRGPLMEQIEQALGFIRKNTNVRFVMTGKPARDEIWDYPFDALRESIINAVCHRDYTVPSDTEIRIYDDKLTVWSPGGLPLGITIDDLLKSHRSILRNKGIAEVFYDLGLIEHWGGGIEKMRNACIATGNPEPEFEDQQHGLTVIFQKDTYSAEKLRKMGLNERQIKAVVHVKIKGRITNKEYREMTGLSDEGVRKDIIELIEKGVLLSKGKGRSAYYVLK